MRLRNGQLLLVTLFVAGPFLLSGQNSKDTIRATENYRWESPSSGSGDGNVRKSYRYIGFQANQLLRQLLGSAGSADNPYLFSYSFNSVAKGGGMNFGLGFNFKTTDDSDASIGLNRTTKASNTAIRVGYDFKKNIGKRWISGFGFDVLRNGSKSETKTTFTSGGINSTKFTTESNGFGFGARFILLFNVSERIYLGTEATGYLMFEKTKSNGDPNFPGNLKQELKENSFELGVPTALFLLLRF